ncbi:MAG TPA: NYN domain-containing protein [Actinomycetota bacterium]|nr:NYN domain-containing protein [Actinomycetota bacterium]
MLELPHPAQAAIARGMAAFMQAARKTDLPASLRPLQGKHQRLLIARRATVVAALEEEDLRALVLEWLDDKPAGINKRDRAVLEMAARREQGWQQRLSETFAETESVAAAQDLGDKQVEVEREKERSRRARDETKRAREAAKREIAEQRRINLELEARVEDLTERVTALTEEVTRLRKEADLTATTNERELRKARKRADRAEAALDRAQPTIRKLKQEVSEVSAQNASSPKKKPVRKNKPLSEEAEPARRTKLAVPKGRFDDDPETLAEWLRTPKVHLLVDGYNVSKAEGGFGDVRLATQRDLLLQAVEKVVRRHRIKATVVFDGSDIPPGASRRSRSPVEVEYSRPDEIADDHLIAKLEHLPRHPVVVATNDKELQRRAARLGATIATSNQLLALIR